MCCFEKKLAIPWYVQPWSAASRLSVLQGKFVSSYANEILFSSCVFQKRNCFLLIYVKCPVAHHVMFTPVTCMFMCCHGDRVHNDVRAVHEFTVGQCSQG